MPKLPLLAALLAVASVSAAAQPPKPDPVRPAITGIAFMRLYTSNPGAAQHFYGDTLGFDRHELPNGVWVYPVNHAQWLEVLTGADPKPNDRLAAIAFTTRDAAGLAKYLESKKVAIDQPLKDGEFGVRDPEGNLVIFVQQGSNKLVASAPKPTRAPSDRIIHVGFIVRDRAKEEAFWKGILNFTPYWYGGPQPGDRTDYVSLQVPDGRDWIEFMLNRPADGDLKEHGMFNHFSLGIEKMDTVLKGLAANGCDGPNCTKTQMGVDGKVQLNLFDPDQTRVEFMEFKPSGKVCCSPFTGIHPDESEDQ